jgi:hypothetical protein
MIKPFRLPPPYRHNHEPPMLIRSTLGEENWNSNSGASLEHLRPLL